MNIRVEDYTYYLPNPKIAKYPLPERDLSKLLIYDKGLIKESVFKNITDFLPKNSLIVFNDSKVIKARLIFTKQTGAHIEIFCLEPLNPSEYNKVFQERSQCKWKCLVGNLKKWKNYDEPLSLFISSLNTTLSAFLIYNHHNWQEIEFEWNNTNITFGQIVEEVGNIPIPPYLNRESEEIDKHRYQTVYSEYEGSVAAPTAGLHFTNELIKKLKENNILQCKITLHVSAGTFQPIKTNNPIDHNMHYENFYVSKKSLEIILQNIGNITSVGTTSLRLLESLYWIGSKIEKYHASGENITLNQWEDKSTKPINPIDAFNNLIKYCNDNKTNYITGKTQLMIVPGYSFKVVDRLITNFHQPQSTLLLLVAAFLGGDEWKKVYEYALNNSFRFLSYGDSSLLIPKN